MILTIENNEISRVNPTKVTLNLIELRDDLVDSAHELYSISKWKRVTFSYVSSVYPNQAQDLIFDVSPQDTFVEIYHKLPENFISEMLLASVTIHGFDNLSFKTRRIELDGGKYDIYSDSLPAPASTVLSSSNTNSGVLDLEEISLWEPSFVVRLFDPITGEPLPQAAMIETIHPETGVFVLNKNLDMGVRDLFLQSSNGYVYGVKVSNEGVLSTELKEEAEASPKFKILKQGTVNEYYVIKVSDEGAIYYERAVLDELDYITANKYTLLSPNSQGWKLNITPDNKLQTEQRVTTLEGYIMKFAYPSEVTIDQLKRYKFI